MPDFMSINTLEITIDENADGVRVWIYAENAVRAPLSDTKEATCQVLRAYRIKNLIIKDRREPKVELKVVAPDGSPLTGEDQS